MNERILQVQAGEKRIVGGLPHSGRFDGAITLTRNVTGSASLSINLGFRTVEEIDAIVTNLTRS